MRVIFLILVLTSCETRLPYKIDYSKVNKADSIDLAKGQKEIKQLKHK